MNTNKGNDMSWDQQSDEFNDMRYADSVCRQCENHEDKLQKIRYWVSEMVETIYKSEKLEPLELERCLDELCYLTDVELGQDEIKLMRLR